MPETLEVPRQSKKTSEPALISDLSAISATSVKKALVTGMIDAPLIAIAAIGRLIVKSI